MEAENKETFEKLEKVLTDKGIEHKITEHEPTLTSEESAKIRGATLASGAKAMLLKYESSKRDSDISLLAKELAKNSKILEQSLNECNTFKNNYKELSVEFAQKRNEIIKLKIECKYLSSEIEKYESIINSNKDNKPAPLDFEKKKEECDELEMNIIKLAGEKEVIKKDLELLNNNIENLKQSTKVFSNHIDNRQKGGPEI